MALDAQFARIPVGWQLGSLTNANLLGRSARWPVAPAPFPCASDINHEILFPRSPDWHAQPPSSSPANTSIHRCRVNLFQLQHGGVAAGVT